MLSENFVAYRAVRDPARKKGGAGSVYLYERIEYAIIYHVEI